MAKQVNDQPIKTKVKNADKQQKQQNREARDKKRRAAVEAKTKAREEAKEKGLPWNDSVPAARFLEDYDTAFMSAIAGTAKVSDPVDPNVVCGVNQDPEADQTPVQTEKTSAQLTLEAAKKHKEELAAATLKEIANDNAEEVEAPTCTGVDVVAKDEPVEPIKLAELTKEGITIDLEPAADTSGIVPSIDLNDPSTWPLEANGGLMRLPGEPGKKFSSRKHKLKLWKREQEKLNETRNGDTPAEETKTKQYPTGELVYHSDYDGQSLTPPTKSAAESANVFEAAAMGQTDESAETNSAPEQSEQTEPTEAPTADPATVAPTEQPLEQTETSNVEETLVVEHSTAAVETTANLEPKLANVPEKKPTLTLATSQSEDEALANRAQKFYGDTWTPERAEKLTKAFKFLEMAIRLQQKGESDSRINMPMTSAIRLETEALGIAVAQVKAA